MNNERRKRIEAINAKVEAFLSVKDELENIMNDEQEAFDNMPESLQGSEKGEKSQEALDALQELISAIEEVENANQSLQDSL